MLLYAVAFLGGILTIVSPCVLPVVPFLFTRADQPFRRTGLPMLAGMASTFAVLAAVATVGAGWIVQATRWGRIVAMVALGIVGLSLLIPPLAQWSTRPLVRIGMSLQGNGTEPPRVKGAFFSGSAIGFLWAPCAGPILGLLLTGAALGGASAGTALLLLSFAAGAATSLGLAMVAGGRLFNFMKRSLGAEAWMKRALGVTVLAGLSVIAMGWDASLLARVKLVNTAVAEQRLVDRLGPPTSAGKSLEQFAAEEPSLRLQDEGAMPEFAGATAWLGSRPQTPASLRGKVVLVDFWTFGCYNCLNALPYVKALHAKYKDHGLVVIGVHTPEFAHERDRKNVERAIRRLGVEYPVVMDNDYRIWRAYHTRYWPAAYYVDHTGRIRYHHFGEGRYAEQEQVVRKLLAEAALVALPAPSTPHARSEQ
ncbi:hypothetical protein BH24GEM2_BH24GEM2_15970 [soil metagenome]